MKLKCKAQDLKARLTEAWELERNKMAKHTKQEFENMVMQLAEEQMFGMGNDGICLACHYVQGGCEPDARNYECESCGERKVFGAEELLIMGHGG